MSPYEKLAAVLDKIPNGFPAVEDGTHLRVLEWIFTPEEAELASQMKLRGETVQELAERLRLDEEGLEEKLETMKEKGQIRAWNSSTGRRYCLMPFAVGIYEDQLNRMDEDFAQLIEDYFQKSKQNSLMGSKPAIFRVIPINKAIDTELEIHPYQVAEQMLENAKSWGVRECICKKQQKLIGDPCKYPETVCLVFHWKKENVFDYDDIAKPLTKEEALDLLKQAEEAGLVHCTMNIQQGHSYICNCCTCCCGILRGLTEFKQPYAFVKSDYLASVDEDLCTGCGTCVERCQLDALEVPDDICIVNVERCIGCGVCTITCPEEALSLVPRAPEETEAPPEGFMDWMTKKAIARDVDPSDLL